MRRNGYGPQRPPRSRDRNHPYRRGDDSDNDADNVGTATHPQASADIVGTATRPQSSTDNAGDATEPQANSDTAAANADAAGAAGGDEGEQNVANHVAASDQQDSGADQHMARSGDDHPAGGAEEGNNESPHHAPFEPNEGTQAEESDESDGDSDDKDSDSEEREGMCAICLEAEANIVLGCGHNAFCIECISRLRRRRCPLCRREIERVRMLSDARAYDDADAPVSGGDRCLTCGRRPPRRPSMPGCGHWPFCRSCVMRRGRHICPICGLRVQHCFGVRNLQELAVHAERLRD